MRLSERFQQNSALTRFQVNPYLSYLVLHTMELLPWHYVKGSFRRIANTKLTRSLIDTAIGPSTSDRNSSTNPTRDGNLSTNPTGDGNIGTNSGINGTTGLTTREKWIVGVVVVVVVVVGGVVVVVAVALVCVYRYCIRKKYCIRKENINDTNPPDSDTEQSPVQESDEKSPARLLPTTANSRDLGGDTDKDNESPISIPFYNDNSGATTKVFMTSSSSINGKVSSLIPSYSLLPSTYHLLVSICSFKKNS